MRMISVYNLSFFTVVTKEVCFSELLCHIELYSRLIISNPLNGILQNVNHFLFQKNNPKLVTINQI